MRQIASGLLALLKGLGIFPSMPHTITKSAEKPRHSCRGWIGVGRAGLNAQAPNKTHAVPEPSMGEGTAEVEAPAFMPGRMSQNLPVPFPQLGVAVIGSVRSEC